MVYVVGTFAALFLGVGYVLQQRVAAQAALDDLLSLRLLLFLVRQRWWWIGIAASVVGAGLGGLALHFASVSTVEPLLSAALLFALVLANVLSHHRTGWQEIGGAVLVTAALTVFLVVGQPKASSSIRSDHYLVALALVITFGVALLLVVIGRNRGRVLESVLLSSAAGVLSGIQDAATRAGLVDIEHNGLLYAVVHPWVWVVSVAGIAAVVISQSGFKAARLDYSLPPLTVAEPLVGIALGISLLGDQLRHSPVAIAMESLSIAAMVGGAVLISRSPSLASPRRGTLVRSGSHSGSHSGSDGGAPGA